MVRRSHAVWAPSWLVVDPELHGSLQVLHLFEPPSIMDPAATEVKAGSRSQLNFKVPPARVRDAPHDGRRKGIGEGFYHLDRRCRAAGRRLPRRLKRKGGQAALSPVAMQDLLATATSADRLQG
jgi:hypothetical protein